MAKRKITEIAKEVLEDFLRENGYELYHIEFVKESRDWFLRVYVDKAAAEKEAYISTDDCEKISRFLSEKLDELDPIQQNYYLEVSSPGLDRELFEEEHYRKFTGSAVEVKLYRPIDGVKQMEGVLEGIENGVVLVKDASGKTWELPPAQIAKTNLAVIF